MAYKLNRKRFIIGSYPFGPHYFNVHFNETSNQTSYSEMYYDVIKAFAQYLNMFYEIFIPTDGQFGILDENGTWDGLVGCSCMCAICHAAL